MADLTDEQIKHLWDTHVGEPTAKLPLTDGAAVRVENEPPLCYPGEWDWNAARKQWRGHAHTDLFEATHWHPLPALPAAMKGDKP